MDTLKKVFDMLHNPNIHATTKYKDVCASYKLYDDSSICVVFDCSTCIYSQVDNVVLDKPYEVITKLDI